MKVSTAKLVRLTSENRLLDYLKLEWQGQLEVYGESLDDYATPHMNHANNIIENPAANDPMPSGHDYGIFAIQRTGDGAPSFDGILHANTARLKKTTGVTLRINWVTLAPLHDFEDVDEAILAEIIAGVLIGGINLCTEEMPADHLKIRLRNHEERRLMMILAQALHMIGSEVSIDVKGNWLHIDDVPKLGGVP